jgi:hypothetical protein
MDVKERAQRKGPHGLAVRAAQILYVKSTLSTTTLNRWTCRDPGSCHKIQASTVSVGQRSCQDLLPAQSSGMQNSQHLLWVKGKPDSSTGGPYAGQGLSHAPDVD